MTTKIPIIPETEVKGHIQAHKQIYSFSFLPKTIDLAEKIELQVKTDIFNSLRFELNNHLWQFVEDSFLAYMLFLELKVMPQYKEEFRLSQLQKGLYRLKKRCIKEWENPHKLEYQKII